MTEETLYNYKALWTTVPYEPDEVEELKDLSNFKYLRHNSKDQAHIYLASPELYEMVNFNTAVQVYPDIWVILIPNLHLKEKNIFLWLEAR